MKVLFALVLGALATSSCVCDKNCEPFNNLKLTLYNGADGVQEVVVKNGLEDLRNAYRIEIANQNIPVLCKHALQDLTKLDTLVIDSSRIKKIEAGAFDNLPSLRNLVIVSNDFESVAKGVFGDLLVRKLNLSSNNILEIEEGAFENMLNLEVIDLSSNRLSKIDGGWFKYTPKLYRIDLMHNQIGEIADETFAPLVKAKYKKDDLEIWLTDNKIRTIQSRAFAGVGKIESLWLGYNEISSIGAEVFANVQHIQQLYLDNNQIGCLSEEFLSHLRVKELDIDSNLLTCDCLKQIKQWAKVNKVELQSLRTGLQCLRASIQKALEDKHKPDFKEEWN